MDVFRVHEQVIADYRAFTSGFVEIRDRRIEAYVNQQVNDGVQWPDPWVSLNPSFASGGTVDDLVTEGLLHPECARIFRLKPDRSAASGPPIRFHQHQRDAIETARSGQSYVLTTGTGSGKSLAYIVPIVDAILRTRNGRGTAPSGVKAIVVYPMNALANSQVGELEKFLSFGYPEGEEPVTFARYTGQEKPDERRRILAEPPDILLTNYVMLELVLTRPDERRNLVRAAQGLRFLALDEVHTYRGRQGADVAMLIRRLRDQCSSEQLQVIGTSATMSSEGTLAQRREVVAGVATRLFGSTVTPERVIGETLIRATQHEAAEGKSLAAAVVEGAEGRLPKDYEAFAAHPLASWAETTFGLTTEAESGALIRRPPTTLPEAAAGLADQTGVDPARCRAALQDTLRAGSGVIDPATRRPLFAFRLHQFLSKGDTVHVSLEVETERYLTDAYQVSVPGSPEKALLPLGFCRECGQEYLVVAQTMKDGQTTFVPRRDADASGGDSVTGYLYVSSDFPWPDEPLNTGRLPESWLTTDTSSGAVEMVASREKYQPKRTCLNTDGTVDSTGRGLPAWFISTPFAFCLRCGVSYEQVRGNDFGKLATLDAEGRSSAVSLLSAAIVRALRSLPADQLDPRARKLLTFVDNRQDASLQAGHLNDFVQVAQLRGALYTALAQAGPAGLTNEDIAAEVTKALGLAVGDFAQAADPLPGALRDSERALRGVVEYQLYVDLQRGWRVTMPNLEQTGLLTVTYRDLPELAALDNKWSGRGPLATTDPNRREELCRILLDEFRRVRAIEVDILTDDGFDRVKRLSRTHLREPWQMSEDERLVEVGVGFNRPAKAGGPRSSLAVTGRGAFGAYLRRDSTGLPGVLTAGDADAVIADLFAVLSDAGLLTEQASRSGPVYQLNAGVLRWHAGGGQHGVSDPLRRGYKGEETARVNPFFRDLYRDLAFGYAGLVAREHTAQVPQQDRLDRESDFRSGALPLLYCSPTMELGVDISDLNAVGMRNVPPTPANYAQRSGRAGRNGQQALVLTYCSTGNAHDSYWFRRSRDMVAGSVVAPRLDLSNEDLVRSHVHAVWLAETDQSLHSSITQLLDTSEDTGATHDLPVYPALWAALLDPGVARRAELSAGRVIDDLRRTWAVDGVEPVWWRDGWVRDQVKGAARAFDDAFDRWRRLYRTALTEYHEQHRLAISTTASKWDRQQAERRRADARNQLSLLRNDEAGGGGSDFYSYRYLASDGFLPGYSFPRLPLAAYIPARRGPKHDGDYLQRPRFVAISEFGPGALIYHEGARYEVTRIQLPRDPGSTASGGAITEAARRCEQCGYHHPVRVGTDRCEHCSAPLGATEHKLLRLSTVFTRRRERISSDEEERRRSGYELEVSFRFAETDDRPGFTRADVLSGGTKVLQLIQGDAAEVRIANVGRRRRKRPDDRGYWLDLHEGAWLTDKQASDKTVDSDSLDSKDDVRAKDQVIPFVDDRRNIVVIEVAESLTKTAAVSLRAALERGIEATFQLEDSELDSKPLPDNDHPGRMLLTEAAEGGAGVLSRLLAEPDAVARVARTALQIIHYDPESGVDLDRAPGARERCELGCYDCLLSYSNQYEHSSIDRHSIVALLQQLATSTTSAGAGGKAPADQTAWLHKLEDSSLERQFLDWLSEGGYRLPDDAQVTVPAAQARPDLVYRVQGEEIAVFVDGPHHDVEPQRSRDTVVNERLGNLGWTVVRVRHDGDWRATTASYRWVFGPGGTAA